MLEFYAETNELHKRRTCQRGSGYLYVLGKGKHGDSDSAHRQPDTSGPCGGQRRSLVYLVFTSRQAEYENVVPSVTESATSSATISFHFDIK